MCYPGYSRSAFPSSASAFNVLLSRGANWQGDVRFTTDVPATGELYTSTLSNFVTTTLAILAILVVLIKLNWQMMLMGLPLTPLFLWAPIVFARSIQNASRRVQDKLAEISDKLQESITATNVVLAFTRERWDINRLKRLFSHLPRIRTKHTLLQSLSGQMSYMGTLICLMFFYWLGGRKVLADEMPVGTMIAFAMYMSQMLGQTQTYVGLYNRIQTAMGAAERVFEFMDTQPGIVDSKDAISPSSVLGRVEFDHVCFSYQSGNRVLSDICLSVEPGEMIAIVGKSGAGKSTLVNLIARFYETSSGRILIDNHNIRQVKLESLRKHIAFVFQETFLFATSVRENIALGRMDADFDDITAAAKNANADGFIRQLPDGYNTYVGERGVKLSVGQKQRVAIARALLRNPRILILDEATSSLDSESEQAIQDALFRLMEGRTSFVIAHRLSTIKKSDRILVLDDGKIVEIGTHIELLERGGLYHKLYTMQFESNESD